MIARLFPEGVRIRITPLGLIFLSLMALLYVASMTSLSSLLLFLVGIFFGCFCVNLHAGVRALRRVSLEIPSPIRLTEGGRTDLPWKARNGASQSFAGVRGLLFGKQSFHLSSLPPQQDIYFTPDLSFLDRGVYQARKFYLCSSFPFGLVEVRSRASFRGEVIVHPAVYPAAAPPASAHDQVVGGKIKGARRSPLGTDFAGVRPFRAEDPLKQIHWKSSSKGQGLMVKTFYQELSGHVALLIDCGSSGEKKIFENTVRAAGSLIFASLDAGHQVEWSTIQAGLKQKVTSFSDGTEILDDLSRLSMVSGKLTCRHLDEALERTHRRHAFCLVLTECPAEVAAWIGERRSEGRSVSLYLPGTFSAGKVVADHYFDTAQID